MLVIADVTKDLVWSEMGIGLISKSIASREEGPTVITLFQAWLIRIIFNPRRPVMFAG